MLILFEKKFFLKAKRIIIAPLDWGIGHATRCIPIIEGLIRLGHKPLIAADGNPLRILKQRFPDTEWALFPAAGITYSNASSVANAVVKQLPRIVRQIKSDHLTINRLVQKFDADAVISDNRFGAYSNKAPSVFISHQLWLQMPAGMQWAAPFANFINHFVIGKYDCCWIPDMADGKILSGKLSHPPIKNVKTSYIGPLSRFADCQTSAANEQEKAGFLVMLSGPEPHRTSFENEIIRLFSGKEVKVWVLRALPDETPLPEHTSNILMFNHLEDDKIALMIRNANNIIARAGYSTLMDLVAMKRFALLVPTPGQPEQEYLAAYHQQQGGFTQMMQHEINTKTLNLPAKTRGEAIAANQNDLLQHLEEWTALL